MKNCLVCEKKFEPKFDWLEKYCSAECARRRAKIVHGFSLTLEQYREMKKKQDNHCEICKTTKPGKGKRFKDWCIDHDHKTGKIRGLICQECNKGLGNFDDNEQRLRSAIRYLRKYGK